jgi:NitT/TauT family transport system substrate-binding protein
MLAALTAAVVGAPRIVRAQTSEKIRIGGVPTDDMTPVYYAIKNGLYQKEGLEVEVVPTASGAASTAAVVGGAYELGKASPISSLVAFQKGLPLAIVANGAIWDPRSRWNALLCAADSPIKTGADCNGKVASAPGLNDLAQFDVLEWVDKNGGDAKTLKWIEIPGSAAAAALGAHRVDLTTLNEPQLTAAIDSGNARVLGNAHSTIGAQWTASVYFARPDWARSKADAVRRWVRVTYESAAYCNTHDRETAPMMSEATKIPAAVMQKMNRIHGSTSSDPALLQPVVELAVRHKALPRSFPAKDAYFG